MSGHEKAVEALARLDLRIPASERVIRERLTGDPDAWFADWAGNPDRFWASSADSLHWFEPWTDVAKIDLPDHRWFVGAKTNLSYNCFERNIERGLSDKVAIHAESEVGESKSLTYAELLAYVSRTANALKALGVRVGDRVVVYMPLGLPGIAAMHACARLGAVHSVVYAGMGAEALRHRIEDSGAKVLVCADVTYRRGKVVALEPIVDRAIEGLDQVTDVLVHRREEILADATEDARKQDFDAALEAASPQCPAEPVDAEHPAFILYTSGTTGKPKGVVHVHGGYMVGVHTLMRGYFDVAERDVWWSTSDIGWIVGHSYIAYGPLLVGATQVIREGTPDYPDPSVTWRLVDRYAVTAMFTAPTAVRMFMRLGEEALADTHRESLRLLFCAGEPFNPEAWAWAAEHIATAGAQVLDNYWQTEVASPMLGTFPGMDARPGYAGKPMPGVDLAVVTPDGEAAEAGEGGLLVMRQPVPWMMKTIWGDPERYEGVWNEKLGGYVTGDIAVCDAEGYWAVLGRSDDVLSVAGHRIGTADVESALITHAAVVESAVIGLPDDLKGERIKAFVVLKSARPSDALAKEIIVHVREALGPIAQPSEVAFVETLPKTRSGKIMRRLLKARELGEDEGDTSTLEE